MVGESMNLGIIQAALAKALENAGFTAMEEYTDLDIREVGGCVAVWAVGKIGLEEAGGRMDVGLGAVRAEVGFKIRLIGRLGEFTDRAEFNECCYDAASQLSCMRQFGSVSLELGECTADMQQKRLARALDVVFRLYMKEIPR